jgi:hypothetical protein
MPDIRGSRSWLFRPPAASPLKALARSSQRHKYDQHNQYAKELLSSCRTGRWRTGGKPG